jgi:hypothetical protein
MIWLTWRQFRVQAVSVYAGLAAIAVVAVVTRPQLVGRTSFPSATNLYYGSLLAMYLLPAVMGVFWGVPLVARELETGTHNLVWNQSVTRGRWLATKLGIGVPAAMLAAGLLSLAVGWWASPIDTAASTNPTVFFPTRMEPVLFAARGIAPVGYAAFAFLLGVAVAILLRRTLAAMAVTLVLFAAVQVLVPALVRPHLLPAIEESVTISRESLRGINGDSSGEPESLTVSSPLGAWTIANETVDAGGNALSPLPEAVSNCLPRGPGQSGAQPDVDRTDQCFANLSALGYHQHLVYQPASRFWPLQWLETALFLTLSALLAWFCSRRLRHLS